MESKEEEIFIKTKRLLFISCLAAGALIASPSFSKPAKKSAGTSQSKARVAQQITQVMRNDRHNQNINHIGGTRYYYGGGSYPYYGYYSGWPYSNWGYGTYSGYYPYSYRGGYPHSGYNNYYSYYTPTYGYNASMVAAVQRGAIASFESRNGLAVDGSISRLLLDQLGLA